MFTGRKTRNLDTSWRRLANRMSLTIISDDSDGGAPLRTPGPKSSRHDALALTDVKNQTTTGPDIDITSGSALLSNPKVVTGVDCKEEPKTAGILGSISKRDDEIDVDEDRVKLCANPQHIDIAATAHTQLNPQIESFIPKAVANHVEVSTGRNGCHADLGPDLLAMIRQHRPDYFENENRREGVKGGNIPYSSSVWDGLGCTSVTRISSPLRACQAERPMMQQSVSMHQGFEHQTRPTNSLRNSHTEPIVTDPHSVAAILHDDSGYDGSTTSTPRTARVQKHVCNTQACTDAHCNPGISTRGDHSHIGHTIQSTIENDHRAHNAVQNAFKALDNVVYTQGQYDVNGNTQTTPRMQVALRNHAPVGPQLIHGGLPPVPATRQPSPGELSAAAQTLNTRPQDLQLKQLATPPEKLFQPPTAEQTARYSHQLIELIGKSGFPSVLDLLDPHKFPFTENCTLLPRKKSAGVLKITNCPFNVSRNEIVAIFGRQARLLNDNDEPIHIILEKVSAKTQDTYVEFETYADAEKAFQRVQESISRGRIPRIGNRQVNVVVSNQAALMQDIFPLAHGVTWQGATPIFVTDSPFPIDNFRCFISEEECKMLSRHFECHGRSPFSRDAPERFIESMISTLKKMPWEMSGFITIYQQHYIFRACQELLEVLLEELDPVAQANRRPQHKRPGLERLTPQVLQRFTNAILLCPGFTVVQKDSIASMVSMDERDMRKYNLPRFAQSYNHLYALGPKPGVPLDVLEYYISVLRQETNRAIANVPIHERRRLSNLAETTDSYFGYFWRELNYPQGPELDGMTLSQAAMLEWEAMERVLRQALATGPDNDENCVLRSRQLRELPQIDL